MGWGGFEFSAIVRSLGCLFFCIKTFVISFSISSHCKMALHLPVPSLSSFLPNSPHKLTAHGFIPQKCLSKHISCSTTTLTNSTTVYKVRISNTSLSSSMICHWACLVLLYFRARRLSPIAKWAGLNYIYYLDATIVLTHLDIINMRKNSKGGKIERFSASN